MNTASVHAVGYAGEAVCKASQIAPHVKDAGYCPASFIGQVYAQLQGLTDVNGFGDMLKYEGVIPGMQPNPGSAVTAQEISGSKGFDRS